jgi:hypothetical protein
MSKKILVPAVRVTCELRRNESASLGDSRTGETGDG